MQGKFSKKKKILKNDFQVVQCLEWVVRFQIITLSTANDNVENNNHLIPLGFQVVRCFGWLVSFQNITLSAANDNLENNNHLVSLGLEPGTLCL